MKFPGEAGLQDERARLIATKYQVWVVVASCAGPTGGGYTATAGRSAIWAPGGEAAARAGSAPGSVVSAALAR